MKVIVAYWVYPYECGDTLDERPKSIERITTSVADLKEWLCKAHALELEHTWFKFATSLYSLCPDHKYYDPEVDLDAVIEDGFEWLYSKLCNDELGICFCKIGNYFYGFQVRNLH